MWSIFDPFGTDAEVARAKELDAKAAEYTRRKIAEGGDEAALTAWLDRYQSTGVDEIILSGDTPGAAFNAEFVRQGGNRIREVKSAANKVASVINDLGTSLLGSVFKAIPWQLWILGIVAAVVYFWPVIRPFAARLFGRMKASG